MCLTAGFFAPGSVFMKFALFLITLSMLIAQPIWAAEVRNLTSGQIANKGFVQYDLVGKLGEREADVTVFLEIAGERYSADKLSLSGDYGRKVKIGIGKRFQWDFMKDFPAGFDGEIIWDVEASGGTVPASANKSLSGGGLADPTTGMESVEQLQKAEPKQAASANTRPRKGKKKGSAKSAANDKSQPQPADNRPPAETVPETPQRVPEQPVAKISDPTAFMLIEPATTLALHSKDILSVAFSSDGSRAASGDRDNTVIVWDARTWTPTATLKGHSNNVQALAFAGKGRQLASGANDQSVIIWDLAAQHSRRTFKTEKSVTSLSYSPGGTHLAIGSKSNETSILDVNSGGRTRTLRSDNDILTIAYSPNGKMLAGGGKEKSVRVWSLTGNGEARILEGHRNDISSLAFTPDGGYLVSGGDDKSIIIWNLATYSIHKMLEGHQDKVIAVAVTRDGRRLLSADSQRSEGTIIVWDLKSGSIIKRIRTNKKIRCISFSHDGSMALVGSDKSMLVYRLD